MALTLNTGATNNQSINGTSLGSGLSANTNGDAFTFGMWFRFAAGESTGSQRFWSIGSGFSGTYDTLLTWDGTTRKFTYQRADSGKIFVSAVTSALTVADATWYWIGVKDPGASGGAIKLFFGATDSTASTDFPDLGSSYDGTYYIGQDPTSIGTGNIKAAIKDLGFWTKALSDAQMQSLGGGADPRSIESANLIFGPRFVDGILVDPISKTTITASNSPAVLAVATPHVPLSPFNPDSAPSVYTTGQIVRYLGSAYATYDIDNQPKCVEMTNLASTTGAGHLSHTTTTRFMSAAAGTTKVVNGEVRVGDTASSSHTLATSSNTTALSSFSTCSGIWVGGFNSHTFTLANILTVGNVTLQSGDYGNIKVFVNSTTVATVSQYRLEAQLNVVMLSVTSGVSVRIWVNGRSETISTAAATGSSTAIRIGSSAVAKNTYNYITCREFAAWNSDKTSDETAITAYLAAKYALNTGKKRTVVVEGSSTMQGWHGSTSSGASKRISADLANVDDAQFYNFAANSARLGTLYLGASGGSGNFTVGETVSQATSLASGLFVLEVGGYVLLRNVVGKFNNSNTITGGSSAATRTVSSLFDNTGAIYLSASGGSGTFTQGEVITQAGTGATGLFLSEAGGVVACQVRTTTAFNGSGAITGNTSGATRNISAFTSQTGKSSLMDPLRLAAVIASLQTNPGNCDFLIQQSSNDLDDGIPAATCKAALDFYLALLRASVPAVRAWAVPPQPRLSSFEANFISFLSLLQAGTGSGYTIIDISKISQFSVYTGGSASYLNATYYADTGGSKAHLTDTGMTLLLNYIAPYMKRPSQATRFDRVGRVWRSR